MAYNSVIIVHYKLHHVLEFTSIGCITILHVGANDLIAIHCFAHADKQSFSSNRQKKERGGKRELQVSTIRYGPPKSQMHGITFH